MQTLFSLDLCGDYVIISMHDYDNGKVVFFRGDVMKSQKRKARYKAFYEKQKRLHHLLREHAGDILDSKNFRSTKAYIQHGDMTVHQHCQNVAKYSIALSEKLRIRCSKRELIRGALLHDYFLYDWHDEEHRGIWKLHGIYHPGRALRNANKEYKLTQREKDIIGKHMWPLTIKPPMCREAWIVTCADKWCSLMETFRFHKGRGAKRA